MRAGLILPCLALVLGSSAQAQPSRGKLVYATAVGRAVTLTVVEGGHPALVTLKAETGTAERFRLFVLAHSGPEAMVAKGARLLPDRAPAGWRVGASAQTTLLRTGEATYWRYTAGLVVPVRFLFDRQEWTLQGAELPPRMLVANPQ